MSVLGRRSVTLQVDSRVFVLATRNMADRDPEEVIAVVGLNASKGAFLNVLAWFGNPESHATRITSPPGAGQRWEEM
jgi:hypothetical protein